MTMRLSEIVETSRRVGEASGRLAKVGHLAALLARCGPEEAASAVALLSGTPRQGRIGIGYAALREARAAPAAVEPSITLGELDRALDELKSVKGKGAAGERLRLLRELFGRATEAEQDFLLRLLVGELRQGALEGVMVEAIAKAAGLRAGEVRRAVMLAGDAGDVAAAALQQGAAGLRRFGLQLMQPVQPMLAQPAEDVADALAQLGEAAFEWKLDGARIQAHKDGQEVRVFTRRLNDVTAAVPEVVDAVRGLPLDSAILDGEAIALRPDGSPQPFQVTMRRFGRKLEVARLQAELPLHCLFFDALVLDGDELIDRPNRERAAALAGVLPPELLVPRLVTGQEAEAEAFVKTALAKGHEGAVAKALEAPYAAGRRGAGWLKVKQAHTLDLVVLAAEWGNGRRQGWLSNLHLGARDQDGGGFVMLGKTFKGLTDELLAWQTEQFLARAMARDRHTVYVRPELVVEIAFNDIQASPHYPGGLALRFARVKAYRPDKRAEDADTIATVRAIHARQGGASPPEPAEGG
jgi:DNA ligase 1